MKKGLWLIIGFVALVLIAAGVYAATRMNSTPTSTTDTSNSSSQNQQSSSSTNKAAIIQTKTDSALGSYLADPAGHPLYTYGGDEQGVSNCTGQCLADWPAYAATTTTNLPANVTVITRSDSTKQYAYKGMALYTFIGDSSSQPTGDNVSNFHIAKP